MLNRRSFLGALAAPSLLAGKAGAAVGAALVLLQLLVSAGQAQSPSNVYTATAGGAYITPFVMCAKARESVP